MFLTAVVFSLCACQSPRQLEPFGPPWNSDTAKHNVKHVTDKDAYIPHEPPGEDESLTFEQCVFTATQFAPDMINSVISLELQELSTEDAYWKRYPKLNATFRVTNNLTKHHEEYRDTAYRIGVGVQGFEPIVSYFSSKASQLFEDVAYYTHQLAVQERAQQIGLALLRMEHLQKVHALQSVRADVARQGIEYYRAKQSDADRLELARATHMETQARLDMEKTETAMDSLRLNLKLMLGLDLDRSIQVQPESVGKMLKQDRADSIFADNAWEDVWAASPEARMLQISRKLRDYDVKIAWAQYLPTVSMDIYTANPRSDYMAPSSDDDIFVRLYLTVPLLDWGARSRGVDKSVLRRVRDTQRAKLGRMRFASTWRETWHDLKMVVADEKLAREQLAVRRLEEQRKSMEQQTGQSAFDALVNARMEVLGAEIELEEATFALNSAEFKNWIMAGGFRKRFFEPYLDQLSKSEGP